MEKLKKKTIFKGQTKNKKYETNFLERNNIIKTLENVKLTKIQLDLNRWQNFKTKAKNKILSSEATKTF